jgi:hypothetical protein
MDRARSETLHPNWGAIIQHQVTCRGSVPLRQTNEVLGDQPDVCEARWLVATSQQ